MKQNIRIICKTENIRIRHYQNTRLYRPLRLASLWNTGWVLRRSMLQGSSVRQRTPHQTLTPEYVCWYPEAEWNDYSAVFSTTTALTSWCAPDTKRCSFRHISIFRVVNVKLDQLPPAEFIFPGEVQIQSKYYSTTSTFLYSHLSSRQNQRVSGVQTVYREWVYLNT
jgi:hypothetical protein